MKLPLFTVSGLIPLRYRRATLALRYLRYALEQPPTRLLHHALEESLALYNAGHSGWLGDLHNALGALPRALTLLAAATLRLPRAVERIISEVDKVMRAQFLDTIRKALHDARQARAAKA
ncbi:unnamed protein product [Peniophora sp. CBMAI 1063]|nr:unnamed protein product [Peniophora sp. CBMAI 1063]